MWVILISRTHGYERMVNKTNHERRTIHQQTTKMNKGKGRKRGPRGPMHQKRGSTLDNDKQTRTIKARTKIRKSFPVEVSAEASKLVTMELR